jgi:aminocarboxymuconate-semialdehyde decarboxylase
VISLTTPGTHVEAPAVAVKLARITNDAFARVRSDRPRRFVPLATLPMQDGTRAAAVLKEAMAAGFRGAMISTLPRGIGSVLDAPDLDPFWAAADETGAVIHIHPSYDAGDTRVNDYGLANGVGRISDAIVAVARLLCSGHVTRYRNARIFVPMGAAGLPFLVGRLARNYKITPGLGDPRAGLASLYADSILHDPRVLRFVVEMVGADRVMMGSDMPFPIGDREPMRIVAEAGFGPEDVVAFGDMPNDVPMLRWAGVGYAMADGHPEAISAADRVAPPCRDDGVAQVLEELLAGARR